MNGIIDKIKNEITQDFYKQNFPNDGQRFVAWYCYYNLPCSRWNGHRGKWLRLWQRPNVVICGNSRFSLSIHSGVVLCSGIWTVEPISESRHSSWLSWIGCLGNLLLWVAFLLKVCRSWFHASDVVRDVERGQSKRGCACDPIGISCYWRCVSRYCRLFLRLSIVGRYRPISNRCTSWRLDIPITNPRPICIWTIFISKFNRNRFI